MSDEQRSMKLRLAELALAVRATTHNEARRWAKRKPANWEGAGFEGQVGDVFRNVGARYPLATQIEGRRGRSVADTVARSDLSVPGSVSSNAVRVEAREGRVTVQPVESDAASAHELFVIRH